MNLNEATHTYSSYSFATFCEAANQEKRGKYFSESFDESERENAFGPNNGCDGDCQGTGWVPVSKDDMGNPYRGLYVQAELDSPSNDGWHFVPCPKCTKSDGEHIVKEGNKFVLKVNGQESASFDKPTVSEETDNPNYRQGQRKVDSDKRAHSDDKDKGKSAADKTDSAAQRKEKSTQRRREKEKDRASKKLMPYEYADQKQAERASQHLGLHGSHTSGNGIYKPGSSEHSLRDAVHQKKEKQKMKGGHFHREEAEGLSTGVGIANPEQVLGIVKRIVRGE